MAVIRVKKSNNYTTMSNFHLRDKNLSLKAKGLLSVMLSLPDDWDYSIAGLVSIVKEEETAVNSALKELKKYGYLEVKKNFPTKENPKISVEYVVYEQPHNQGTENQYTGNQGVGNQPLENQGVGNQGVENQGVENQGVENQGQLSTDIVNTEKQNTEKQRTENKEQQEEKFPYDEIIAYLNEKCGTRYKATKSTKELIHARIEEGFTKDDCFTVIDNKVASWKGTEWEKYLRPSTLFNASKFQGYLNEKPVEKKHAGSKEGYSVDISKYDTI